MSSLWMLDMQDPACSEIVHRAMALGITSNPDKAAHNLGAVTLADGQGVTAHVIHAVDAIITDGEYVVMINRRNPPGEGKPCLPGGFIDIKEGNVESAVQAAIREAMEEVGVVLQGGILIGQRNVNRPFDIRIARNTMPEYGVAAGDVFLVSTQAVCFDIHNLADTKFRAGDDAAPGSVRRIKANTLSRETVGIPDHFDMIVKALPKQFM